MLLFGKTLLLAKVQTFYQSSGYQSCLHTESSTRRAERLCQLPLPSAFPFCWPGLSLQAWLCSRISGLPAVCFPLSPFPSAPLPGFLGPLSTFDLPMPLPRLLFPESSTHDHPRPPVSRDTVLGPGEGTPLPPQVLSASCSAGLWGSAWASSARWPSPSVLCSALTGPQAPAVSPPRPTLHVRHQPLCHPERYCCGVEGCVQQLGGPLCPSAIAQVAAELLKGGGEGVPPAADWETRGALVKDGKGHPCAHWGPHGAHGALAPQHWALSC